jgi:CubicO group peptidase (beta-lactamase class C family)
MVGKIAKWLAIMVVVVGVGATGWLYFFPPELIRVGAAYSAKIACSNAFLAHRDAAAVLADDVQAPGHPLLKHIELEKVGDDGYAASLYGILARETAIYRDGLGCTVVADHDLDAARKVRLATRPAVVGESDYEWPMGDQVSLAPNSRVTAVLADAALTGPGMRAVVVVKDGKIVGEIYGKGYAADTPLMGWSMTKTVTGALVAARVAEGKLKWDQDKLFPAWSDDRAKIKISDLMAMQSGLSLEETYGDVNDVTRMLFLEPDQSKFVEEKQLEVAPGSKWKYTTGSAVLLSKIWMNTFADQQEALSYPRKALFGPIGMRSAVMETDENGTFSGGSLMYATARDWARFGLLLADKGDWNGVQVLPEDFSEMVGTASRASSGQYTNGLAWKSGPQALSNDKFGLPADTFWVLGHDGQSIAIIPSEKLVVVRLGLTPGKLGYVPQHMVQKIVEAAKPMPGDDEQVPDALGESDPGEE